jgi:dienelactone hydrolase
MLSYRSGKLLRMRLPAAAAGVLLLATALARAQPAPPALWAGLQPGSHAVGFTTERIADPARRADGQPRQVQVSCWFPATGPAGVPLTFRDYFLLSAAERGTASVEAKRAAISDERKFFASVGVEGALVDRWFDAPVFARAGGSPARGAFPLVLVAQGNGQPAHYQAVLSEFIASHGFVVCTTPSQSRLGTAMTSEADVLPSATAQAADLRIAERYAREHYHPRAAPPGVVGHSFGGRSALVLAAGGHAAAIVSLDGGIGAEEARSWVEGLPLDRTHFATPILHIYEEGDRAITPDLTLIRSLARSDRTLVTIDAMRHIDFTSLGFGAATVEGLTGKAPPSLGAKCRRVATLTWRFLEATLDGPAGRAFQPPAAADPWMHVEHLPRRP